MNDTASEPVSKPDKAVASAQSESRRYPKRLIEVDLPIARISANALAARRKRSGNIASLHMWWARRPSAACRAVICAALWPDPADELCPQAFRDASVELITSFAHRVFPERINVESKRIQRTASPEGLARWEAIAAGTLSLDAANPVDMPILRFCLLDFVADFAKWDNASDPIYVAAARDITNAAHLALDGTAETKPLIVDPFAGGGAIPLEALRLGADVYASDLNPVAVLINKTLLEYGPRYGEKLADSVQEWGNWLRERAVSELGDLYPQVDGRTPLAYLWARTLACEGPQCGATVPLLSRLQITKRHRPPIAVFPIQGSDGNIDLDVRPVRKGEKIKEGTARGGSVTCPLCNHTINEKRYRELARDGALGEQLYAVVLVGPDGDRHYRAPTKAELDAFEMAKQRYHSFESPWSDTFSTFPDEPISEDEPRRLNIRQYGFTRWVDLFNVRQRYSLATLGKLAAGARDEVLDATGDREFADAVGCVLTLCISNLTHYNTNVSTYLSDGMISAFIQSSAIAMRADYAEANPLVEGLVGGFEYQLAKTVDVINHLCVIRNTAVVDQGEAQSLPLPSDSVDALVTDPPYYFSIPYADLSDLFFCWLKRFLHYRSEGFLKLPETPKAREATQSLPHSKSPSTKDKLHYESAIRESFEKARDLLKPSAVSVVVFAHTSTDGWETVVSGLIDAGWTITASWPIDTENVNRMLANRQRTLASSVHLVCRPRELEDGRLHDAVGEWRDVLSELPQRIHEWMPRLAQEGVVGADAIFACLGPALEIFSRYGRVEKSSGEAVPLREYLEQVWAAVSTEALSMIFKDADAAGLEPDARLTAIWFWTLGAGSGQLANGNGTEKQGEDSQPGKSTEYALEFDAARKIAQGLGVNLDTSDSIVEIKGDKARLLSVSERTRHLFGADEGGASSGRRRQKEVQRSLFEELDEAEAAEAGWTEISGPPVGNTVLDRLHQAMILFAAGRGELMKRFLQEDGVGHDARFWKLAQSLLALYPVGSEEKRWVDGVLSRKKSLGF